jgi:DUF971 family protein
MTDSRSSVHPTEVRRLPEERRLRVTWSDGHVGEYDYAYLRGYCPCAACQGHTNEAIHFHPPPGGSAGLVAEEIQPVGNYAISIRWSDGHDTGIYRFDFLRRLCPCDACEGDPEDTPPIERG